MNSFRSTSLAGRGSGSDGSIGSELDPECFFFPNARLAGPWGVLDDMISIGNYLERLLPMRLTSPLQLAVEANRGPHYTRLLVGRDADYTTDDVWRCESPTQHCLPPPFRQSGFTEDIIRHTDVLVKCT
jgi:hypothetical protein